MNAHLIPPAIRPILLLLENRTPATLVSICCCMLLGGCWRGTAAQPVPQFDAQKIAERTISAYDANHDGAISKSEIDKSPALRKSLPRLDKNRDGRITADEIADRVRAWIDRKTLYLPVTCKVTLAGSPVEGATVTFVPEEFLGPEFKPASGTTGQSGSASIWTRPDVGVAVGFYRIQISKQEGGKEVIPAKYNTATQLGQEVAPDVDELRGAIRLELNK